MDNTGFTFILGNQLMYIAYSSGYLDNTMVDSPNENTNYTFNMVPVTTDVLPTVTTSPVTNITLTTATTGGNVTSDGGATVTARGVCWSTSTNPTTADPHTYEGGGTGSFVSYLSGLSPGTLYHVRAYATNSVGTAYGVELNFTTLPVSIPVVITSQVTNIGSTNATSGGNVTSDGGEFVTARGVCWSTTSEPTTADPHTIDGSGTGTFASYLTGLTENTLYYVRAYATNSVGTAYGNEVSFTTLQVGVHYIGESFGGGIIFYLDGTGQHGLISSMYDQGLAEWGCYGTYIGGTANVIGSGQANTTAIINGCSQAGTAARICDELVLNGYSDWFLPSLDELYEMYIHRDLIGNFNSPWPYWSSTEFDGGYAYIVTFWGGGQYFWEKTESDAVRAIRAF
jgi:hypothetical protein